MAPIMESLLNKVASLQACNFIKKRTPTQVFSCGVCKVFKNTYFEEYLRTTAFVVSFSWLYVHYYVTDLSTKNKMKGVCISTKIQKYRMLEIQKNKKKKKKII